MRRTMACSGSTWTGGVGGAAGAAALGAAAAGLKARERPFTPLPPVDFPFPALPQGCDCLGFIRYFDAHMSNFIGGVETIENAVCMHEEDHGMLWKHVDWRSGHTEVRRSRRLVLSFVCTVANYEYGFFWYLYQDGKIEAQVKLTGILSVGTLREGEERKYGTLLAPGLYAPIHPLD
ncbi:unnamed protein product [Closterium sp. NIES-54]